MGCHTDSKIKVIILLLSAVAYDLRKGIYLLIDASLPVADRLQGKRELIKRAPEAFHIQRRERISSFRAYLRQLHAAFLHKRLDPDPHIGKRRFRYRR